MAGSGRLSTARTVIQSTGMQLCDYLAADSSTAQRVFFDAVFAHAREAPSVYTPRQAAMHKRPWLLCRRSARLQTPKGRRSIEALDLLASESDSTISLILEAACAHRDVSDLRISAVLAALPPPLHMSAARGHFGTSAATWQLDMREPHVCSRLLQLVTHQQRVTGLELVNGASFPQADSIAELAHAAHLRYVAFTATAVADYAASATLTEALRQCAHIPHLRSIAINDCAFSGAHLPKLAESVCTCTQLTALHSVGSRSCTPRDSAGVAAVAPCLSKLTGVRELRLIGVGADKAAETALNVALKQQHSANACTVG